MLNDVYFKDCLFEDKNFMSFITTEIYSVFEKQIQKLPSAKDEYLSSAVGLLMKGENKRESWNG